MVKPGRVGSGPNGWEMQVKKAKTKTKKTTAADNLVSKAKKTGEVELKEDELNKVSGGLIALLDKAS